jgi:hypothetical protein
MKNLLLLITFCGVVIGTRAQSSKATQNTKPPVFNITWGGRPAGKISAEQFKKIVDSPLVVKDEKGVKYPITRFRINYIFLNTYKDSESQMEKSVQDLRVSDFYDTSSLSEMWRSSLRDNAKKGDTVLINNVIVKLKNNKKMNAPSFKASVE